MSDLLSLPDIKTIEPPQENETDMMFKVEAVGPPERCPECGFDKLYKHSSRNQLIMDLPIRLKRVGLQLNRRRYKCRERRTIYDIKPNRNKETGIQRLSEISDRTYIEYVTMDMWKPYKDAVNTILPHAKVVVDKFHVVRMANQALDNVRKSLKAHMSQKERRTLMRERFILLKRKHDLNERESFLLDTWLGNLPALKEAYELKEEFYWIWDTPDPDEGRLRYSQWRHRCMSSNSKDAYKDLVRAVDNWHVEIFNYFDKRLTNAYTESINSIIRQVERMGRGYSFDALRAKILFNEKLHKKRKPRFNSSAFNKAMLYDTFNWYEVNDHDITDNFGVDFSTLIKNLEKGDL